MADTCGRTSIQHTTPRVDANVNYGFGGLLLCQLRFLNFNNCPTLVRVLIMGDAMHIGEHRYLGNLCTFPLFLQSPALKKKKIIRAI